jgi:hypothetical protein
LNLNENAMDYYAKLIAAINEKNEIDGEKYANLLKELELGENCEELRYCAFRILLDIRKGDFIKAESLCGELYENIKKCLSENHI